MEPRMHPFSVVKSLAGQQCCSHTSPGPPSTRLIHIKPHQQPTPLSAFHCPSLHQDRDIIHNGPTLAAPLLRRRGRHDRPGVPACMPLLPDQCVQLYNMQANHHGVRSTSTPSPITTENTSRSLRMVPVITWTRFTPTCMFLALFFAVGIMDGMNDSNCYAGPAESARRSSPPA